MLVIALWPLVLFVVGVLIWALVSEPKLSEIAKWLWIVSLFWLVAALAHKTVSIGAAG